MEKSLKGALGRAAVPLAIVAAVLGTSGCKKLFKKKGGDAGAATTTAAQDAIDEQDENLSKKLDEYIKCLNALSSNIHSSRRRYLRYIPKDGPTGKERFADLYRLRPGSVAQCRAGITRASTIEPDDKPLEGAATEYANAASAIDALMNTADRYYETKGFIADKWARGKIMHPQLMSAFDRFGKADAALHTELDKHTKPLAKRALERIERYDGKKFRYWRKSALIAAREVIESADPIGDDDDVDVSLLQSHFTEFEGALDQLTAYGAANRAELDVQGSPNWPVAASHYDSFLQAATGFREKTANYIACLNSAPPNAKAPSGKIDPDLMGSCPAGRPIDVVDKYNNFIRTSNSNQFP